MYFIFSVLKLREIHKQQASWTFDVSENDFFNRVEELVELLR